MATTTNYGWTTPDDTALVKDGASAIRTLGSSVDTTTKALNPSTTLGDIEYRSSTANTNTRLGIGTTGQVLSVSGGVPAWATPAPGGGMTLINSGGTALTGSSVNIQSIPSTYKHLLLIIQNVYAAAANSLLLNFNNDFGNNYARGAISTSGNTVTGAGTSATSEIDIGTLSNSSTQKNLGQWMIWIPLYTTTASVGVHSQRYSYNGTNYSTNTTNGIYDGTAAVDRIDLTAGGGTTFTAGTAYLYGVS